MEKRNFKFDCSVLADAELKQIQKEIQKELEYREYVKKERAWLAVVEAIENYGGEIQVHSSIGNYLGTVTIETDNLGVIRINNY